MNSIKIKILCVSCFLIIVAIFAFKLFAQGKVNSDIFEPVPYVVSKNDTLWDIATAHNYDNEDIREVIYRIRQYNNIDPIIYPNQVIYIPIRASTEYIAAVSLNY